MKNNASFSFIEAHWNDKEFINALYCYHSVADYCNS